MLLYVAICHGVCASSHTCAASHRQIGGGVPASDASWCCGSTFRFGYFFWGGAGMYVIVYVDLCGLEAMRPCCCFWVLRKLAQCFRSRTPGRGWVLFCAHSDHSPWRSGFTISEQAWPDQNLLGKTSTRKIHKLIDCILKMHEWRCLSNVFVSCLVPTTKEISSCLGIPPFTTWTCFLVSFGHVMLYAIIWYSTLLGPGLAL